MSDEKEAATEVLAWMLVVAGERRTLTHRRDDFVSDEELRALFGTDDFQFIPLGRIPHVSAVSQKD